MRPKGSDRNKAIAAAVAAIAVQYSDTDSDFVYCHGPCSLYSFFAAILPQCARDVKNVSINPDGVSKIEMNKILVKSGFQVYRKRELVAGTKDQWKRGCRRWKHRRWTDPGLTTEYEELIAAVMALHLEYPESVSLSLETFCHQLSFFRSGAPDTGDYCQGSDEGESSALAGPKRLEECNHVASPATSECQTTQEVHGPVSLSHNVLTPIPCLHETFLETMLQCFSIFDDATAGPSTVDEQLQDERLGPVASFAMDIDAADSALVAATRAALAPDCPAQGHRHGLLSARIPVASVPRPELRARRCVRYLDPAARCGNGPGGPRWAGPILHKVSQCGFRERELVSEFQGLAPDLARAVQLAACATIVLVQANAVQSGCLRLLRSVGLGRNSDPPPWVYSGLGGPGVAGDDVEDAPPLEESGVGVSRFTFDPTRKMLLVEYYCNPTYVQMTGFSVEELLARVGCRDVPLPFSELDHVCILLDYMWSRFEPRTSHCIRWGWPGQEPVLLHRTICKACDSHGRCWQENHVFRIVTPEEFDALNATVPALRGGCFLRLRAAMGDKRNGADYLADFHADRRTSLSYMRETPEGRLILSRLADAVVEMFVPVIGAARLRCGSLTDWIFQRSN